MSETKHDLLEALSEFDGKALTLLGETNARFEQEPDYLTSLIEISRCDGGHVSSGATWLLKHHLENGDVLTPFEAAGFLSSFPSLKDWQAKLHFCQSLQFVDLSLVDCNALGIWLKCNLSHEKPFLRAWSLDGLVQIGLAHEGHMPDIMAALENAREDCAASVRARARNLFKKLG